MLYTIQNAFGDVYGTFKLPEDTRLSTEGLQDGLRSELEGILGSNGVTASNLVSDGKIVDRVVVDIEPDFSEEDARIAQVHEAIGRLTQVEDIPTGSPDMPRYTG